MVNELHRNTTSVKAARQCQTASKGGSLDKTIMYVAELATSVIGQNQVMHTQRVQTSHLCIRFTTSWVCHPYVCSLA